MGTHFHGTAARRSSARDKIARAAVLTVHHAPEIHYTQGAARWQGISRRLRSFRGQYPTQADCSAHNTWCYWDGLLREIRRAGLGDIVNGAAWKAGFTGTMLDPAHGKTIARGVKAARRVKLLKADLVIYGDPNVGSHVAIVVDPKRRLVVSHGSEAGPFLIRLDYRTDIVAVKRFIY